jgi:hypothetical protein
LAQAPAGNPLTILGAGASTSCRGVNLGLLARLGLAFWGWGRSAFAVVCVRCVLRLLSVQDTPGADFFCCRDVLFVFPDGLCLESRETDSGS